MPHQLNANLSQTAFPEDGGETECRVEIDPDSNQNERLPVHIVFCIDQSGSMSGNKIRQAKDGVKNAMSLLDQKDKFGVVTFDNDAYVAVKPTSGDQSHQAMSDLDEISSGGGTHIINGLEESRNLLKKMNNSNSSSVLNSNGEDVITWIALVTDGRPSSLSFSLSTLVSGITSGNFNGKVEKHGAVAETLNDDGITINTAGVGNNYGEKIIEALSSRSGGTWEHHSSASGIGDFFKQKIREAHNVVATNPTLTFEPKNDVEITDIVRTVPQIADVNYNNQGASYVVTDFPDIRKDISPEYIFDLKIPSHEIAPDVTFGDITLNIGTEVLQESVKGDYVIDASLARDMDEGDKEIAEESDTADNYLGRKDNMDKQTKEQESNSISRKRQ